MTDTNTTHQCFNCRQSEADIPLLQLRYSGSQAWICPQCLPTLIHQPQTLAGKMVGAQELVEFAPAAHQD